METNNSRLAFVFDLIVIYSAFFYVHWVYEGLASVSPKSMALMGLVAVIWFLISLNSHMLRFSSASRLYPVLFDTVVAFSMLTAALIAVVAIFDNFNPNDKLILYPMLFGVCVCVGYRIIYVGVCRHFTINGYRQKNALLIGGGRVAEKTLNRIVTSPNLGYRVCGVLSDNYHASMPKGYYLGKLDRFQDIVRTSMVDEVIIAKPLHKEQIILDLVEQCEQEGIRFYIVPDFFRIIRNRAVVSRLGDIPLIAIRAEPLNLISNRIIKRSFDVVIALTLLVGLSPVLLILALVIKCTSRGPVLFKQARIGSNNRSFEIYKFRSMTVQPDQDSDTIWTTANDPRVTAIGKFMRQYNLDELPQLWNVVIGNMSLVGPRPERAHFVEQFRKEVPAYKVRHQVKSGITGWAQVNGWRGDTSIAKRVAHDIWYLENWTFWLDVKILLMTVFSGKGFRNAY